jgi:glycosylphosphatidylinositol transamidase (GPIT) subunit GPI8
MHEKARYRRLLLFVETCEAETLTDRVYSPGVLTIATSKLGAALFAFHILLQSYMGADALSRDTVDCQGTDGVASRCLTPRRTLERPRHSP